MSHFHIEHIDDVLPHIEGRSDFIVADKGAYKVIDYVYTLADSFDHPARLECRGLKFSADGAILARPLHKFFNINERPDTQAGIIDFSKPHIVMEKMDGSMIHPAIVDGEVVLMTRMGHTDVAKKAERHLTPDMRQACSTLLMWGWTPIFEWTAPDNRIIVRYEDSKLTLLTIRDTVTGYYATPAFSESWAAEMGVSLVTAHDLNHPTGLEFAAYARTVMGMEGFVVQFEDGIWIKAKGEDYVMKHRAKDSILQEKNLLTLILAGGLDDVLPLLDDGDASAAALYADELHVGIAKTAAGLEEIVGAYDGVSQKEFAINRVSTLPRLLRPLAFQVRGGADASLAVRASLIANAGSQTKVDEYRELHGARWAA